MFDSFKLKEFADDNFRHNENGMKSSLNGWKRLWKKEKLLIITNFPFSHTVFKRLILQTCKTKGLFGKGITFYCTTTTFNDPEKERFLKTLWERKKMLVSSSFFSFPHFLPFPNQISIFGILFILSSANAFDLDKSKILSFGKESKCTLTLYHTILTFNESFKNIVEKGENAGKDHFLIFQCFSILSKLHLIRCLQMLSVWSCPKICRLEKAYST